MPPFPLVPPLWFPGGGPPIAPPGAAPLLPRLVPANNFADPGGPGSAPVSGNRFAPQPPAGSALTSRNHTPSGGAGKFSTRGQASHDHPVKKVEFFSKEIEQPVLTTSGEPTAPPPNSSTASSQRGNARKHFTARPLPKGRTLPKESASGSSSSASKNVRVVKGLAAGKRSGQESDDIDPAKGDVSDVEKTSSAKSSKQMTGNAVPAQEVFLSVSSKANYAQDAKKRDSNTRSASGSSASSSKETTLGGRPEYFSANRSGTASSQPVSIADLVIGTSPRKHESKRQELQEKSKPSSSSSSASKIATPSSVPRPPGWHSVENARSKPGGDEMPAKGNNADAGRKSEHTKRGVPEPPLHQGDASRRRIFEDKGGTPSRLLPNRPVRNK
ncbi:unnamed protein product [Amoebophrya sp. A120]|nr:unnamed protein product [Amoebophrya sp. A120]|eukprot:GSA120T00004743001.1